MIYINFPKLFQHIVLFPVDNYLTLQWFIFVLFKCCYGSLVFDLCNYIAASFGELLGYEDVATNVEDDWLWFNIFERPIIFFLKSRVEKLINQANIKADPTLTPL